MRSVLIRSLNLLAICFVTAASTNASAVRIALRTEVSISGDAILLSHLLEKPVPNSLFNSASRISLGRTPQFGTVRRLSHVAVEAALTEAGLNPDDFLIPDSLAVRRAGRVLKKEEIAFAIRDFLESRELQGGEYISPEHLSLPENIAVPDADLALYVKNSAYDATLGRERLGMASRAFPLLNPFEVTLSNLHVPHPNVKGGTVTKQNIEKTTLVEPGTRAQMVATAADIRMVLTVVPLAKGSVGDIIRVRLANSSKYLHARIIAQNVLEAIF